MPRKNIRIEPMNTVPEGEPVKQQDPVVEEPLPQRTNCTELSDEMLAAIVEEVKGDTLPTSKPKRTRRPKVVEAAQPTEPEPTKEPEIVRETAPIQPALDESDVVSTEAGKPEKIMCAACGKMLSMKSFKYSHSKTCAGLKGKGGGGEGAKGQRAKTTLENSVVVDCTDIPQPERITMTDVRTQRTNLRKERMARLFSSAV